MKIIFQDLGLIDYKKAWDYQEGIFENIISFKTCKTKVFSDNYLLFCEHPHVYTLGKNGVSNNLLINDDFLKTINAGYYRINRGGDITYHGPGQIVGYPILDIEILKLSLKDYIYKVEESIIHTLEEFNINAFRLEGASGVWLDIHDTSKTRKICAIGVRASRYVTMHGFAFNINTDLSYFNHINPCGFIDKGVTSLQKELGHVVEIESVKTILKKHLFSTLGLAIS